ncbi:MAG: TetR/AcrR family transcriptional regulator [Pseudomonadota bacterium]|uniref:TetR/AcrR family transcriptional regulator n=1 Tax=Phenylobacterium sp. TaxID=1871053 RepID=UPI00271EAA24|nr:TetR/AcrR family transcriptional regulator [Phenylobacterium sp.]MDO8379258.1 TetR/AcrR family transcriptional regulator [Phenylobacterium sp.]
MPRVLSETDVAEFRERLCVAAERLFAERGPDAVTMRQLAAELGVSPMTPYRYFADKEDILAAVRTNGFNRFAEALETAYASAKGARAKGAAVGEAYLNFAFEHPQTYKLMFDLDQPHVEKYPDLVAAGHRAHETQTQYVKTLVADGVLAGDPEEIGKMFWAAAHGAVGLELAGKLPPGAARELHRHLNHALARGLRPGN